jgi:hypothetical protein
MGLFGKKESKESVPKLPELPKLPRLPTNSHADYQTGFNLHEEEIPVREFPTMEKYSQEIHELPTFPANNFNDKFSQNSIKSAISGRNEEMPYVEELEDYEIDSEPMEKEPELKKILPPIPKTKPQAPEKQKPQSDEPVFIRIDKFEESLKIFDKVKEKISEIEHLLKETKELKEKENEELSNWEEEVQKLKMHIEKVDKDVFSKID